MSAAGPSAGRVVAVDLGASSGRVYAADIARDHLELHEVSRFPNGALPRGDTLHWDIQSLYQGVLDGLGRAGRVAPVGTPVLSVGIDSWGVDYGLLRADGSLVADPISHRDPRTAAAFEDLARLLGPSEIYRRTGIALLPISTLFQLATDSRAGKLADVAQVLLIPDLLAFFLSGNAATEVTNGSTTQLLNLSGEWDEVLLGAAGVSRHLFAPLIQPGCPLGEIRRQLATELGLPEPVQVTAVASHDTASAVVAVPAVSPDSAFISCGTWSLVGVELEHPVVTEAARREAFTNAQGLDGTTLFLRNVMGLWLLQQAVATWESRGETVDLGRLITEAEAVAPLRTLIDPNALEYLTPGDMPGRIAEACRRRGQPVPTSQAEVTRCILDSLALAYRLALHDAATLSGQEVAVIHLVGGGAQNRMLCQLTADACGLPVVAGPVEAAAIGNALVQARALGILEGDRWALRRMVAAHIDLQRYEPRPEMTGRFATAAF